MLAKQLGLLLRAARKSRRLSRADLAKRGGVSVRLVAELEQGNRPNVSLESALTLLRSAGVTLVARAPGCVTVEIRDASAEAFERAERAVRRRATWTSRQVPLRASGDAPPPPRSRSARLAAVEMISRQAYAMHDEVSHREPRRRTSS